MLNKLSYLTVQDVLWINLETTGHIQTFKPASLEDTVYAQYGYGQSNELLRQALQFFNAFLKSQPFQTGNTLTGFVAFLTFLNLNKKTLELPDHEGLAFIEYITGPAKNHDAFIVIESICKDLPTDYYSHIQPIASNIIRSFSNTVHRCKDLS